MTAELTVKVAGGQRPRVAEGRQIDARFVVGGNVDRDGDVVMPGAFDETVSKHVDQGLVPHVLDHVHNNGFDVVGPTLKATVSADGSVDASVGCAEHDKGSHVLGLARSNALTGCSFKAWLRREKWTPSQFEAQGIDIGTRKSANAIVKASFAGSTAGRLDFGHLSTLTVLPANPGAVVLGLKGAAGDFDVKSGLADLIAILAEMDLIQDAKARLAQLREFAAQLSPEERNMARAAIRAMPNLEKSLSSAFAEPEEDEQVVAVMLSLACPGLYAGGRR